jgi:hypothetical protein
MAAMKDREEVGAFGRPDVLRLRLLGLLLG